MKKSIFLERVVDIHEGKGYTYPDLSDEVMYNDKILIICPTHGEFIKLVKEHIGTGKRRQGCKKCGNMMGGMKQRHHTPEYIENVKLVHGDIYDYSETVYVNSCINIQIFCKTHGVFWQRPDHHLNGSGCPVCGGEKTAEILKKSSVEFINNVANIHTTLYDYSMVIYKNNKTKVKIICPTHGIFEQTPSSHLSGKGCLKCGVIKRANTQTDTSEGFIKKAKLMKCETYVYSEVVYKNSSEKVEIICKTHGSFWQTPNSHLMGRGCPQCSENGPSKPEQEIYDYITSIYSGKIRQSDRTLIDPLELDIVIPDLKIAIEYNGLYWHSEEAGKDKNYHLNKTERCKAAGYQLIHIFETEWTNKQNIVKSRLKAKLGLIPNKIYARKCHIAKITSGVAHFLNKNHIQGACPSSINYGLIYENQLIALMTFGASRYSKNGGFELIRYVNRLDTVVVGGASRLFKHFRQHHPGRIVSYSDRRWNTGDMYEAIGMIRQEPSNPCYWYFQLPDLKLSHRSKFQKHKLEKLLKIYDEKKTELENMKENGWSRIFDCGNDVFVLE